MTDDRIPLAELMSKSGDGDFLRTVAESVLQIIMEADADGLIGAGRHERSGERSTWRNGYRDRTLDTRLGTLNLKIPKLRTGAYFPGFLEPRKTAEKALVSVIQEAWIAGVSTRRVDELVQAMGMSGISKSSVSKLCKDIDERVNAFLKRPLVGEWPYLWLDATYLKVREDGRIVSVAAIIAVAVNTEGKREIIGLHHRPERGRTLLVDFPARPRPAGPQRREAGDLRRPRGSEGRHHTRRRRHLAALPCPLHAQRAGARAEGPEHRRCRRDPAGLPPARSCRRYPDLASRRRPAPRPMAEAWRLHGRCRARRARIHDLPRAASLWTRMGCPRRRWPPGRTPLHPQ